MDKENPKMNMPKFNMNWIYAIIIITLAFLFFTGGNSNGSSSRDASY